MTSQKRIDRLAAHGIVVQDVVPILSPEETGNYQCPACPNRTKFVGVDARGYGGPDECHETDDCLAHGYCVEDTELKQPFTVREDGEIDYACFEGGGYDAEIGSYTTILCGECGAVVWREVAN